MPAGAAGEAGIGEGEVKTITIGSLFDGISGFPLAGQRNGMTALWASEIEPFPIKVTKTRFPDMKHLGDITKINGAEIDPVDIITFGSPCQDLSVAGKRAGLAGERSGLFMEAVRIIKEMRNAYAGTNEPIRPRFAVWENVPGAFSSNKGEDFRAVLEEICRVKDETVIIPEPPKEKWSTVGAIMGNGYSVAWRVLDAQYWGVPQRRRRIFLVADFGGGTAPEILFKRKGLSRYLAESGEAREEVAASIRDGVEDASGADLFNLSLTGDVACSLNTNSNATGAGPTVIEKAYTIRKRAGCEGGETREGIAANAERSVGKTSRSVAPFDTTQITSPQNGNKYGIQGSMIGRADKNGPQGDGINEDVSFTLNTTDRHAVATKVYGICSYASNSMKSSNPHSGIYEAETSRTIDLNGGSPACNQGGMAIVQCIEPRALSRGQGERVWDKCPTLRANMGDNQLYALDRASFNQGKSAQYDFQISEDDKTQTVVSRGPNAVAEPPRYSVRRLTPLECERLQGFPDGWTDIPGQAEASKEELEFWRDVWLTWDKTQAENPEKVKPRTDNRLLKWLNNPVSDSAQYKALGNSVAVPCPEYVLEGIKEVMEAIGKEHKPLFGHRSGKNMNTHWMAFMKEGEGEK